MRATKSRAGIDWRQWAVRWLISAIALVVAALLISGIHLDDWTGVAVGAAIFGLVNAFVKPIVKVMTCGLYLVTLGLFCLVVNAAMLGLAAFISGQVGAGFRVDGPIAAIEGGVITGVVSFVAALVL